MHLLFQKADELSRVAIGAAIEVHRHKGPGLIESIYERCLMHELSLRGLTAVNQRLIRIEYKGLTFEELSAIAPAGIEADVRAAALAESLFGAARGFGTFSTSRWGLASVVASCSTAGRFSERLEQRVRWGAVR